MARRWPSLLVRRFLAEGPHPKIDTSDQSEIKSNNSSRASNKRIIYPHPNDIRKANTLTTTMTTTEDPILSFIQQHVLLGYWLRPYRLLIWPICGHIRFHYRQMKEPRPKHNFSRILYSSVCVAMTQKQQLWSHLKVWDYHRKHCSRAQNWKLKSLCLCTLSRQETRPRITLSATSAGDSWWKT